MSPLFQFTIVLKMDEEKRRSAPVTCNKTPDEIMTTLHDIAKSDEDTGLTGKEVLVLAWLFDCFQSENCACAGCFDSWLEEENMNEHVMAGAMLSLVNKGWVEVLNLREEVPN